MCGYMDQSYLPFLNIVSQKMIPHFYVFCFGMEHWVLCSTYGTGVVTLKWDMCILLTKVTHGVCDLKELRATTSSGNVLCLGSGFSNTRLFAGRPRYQRRSQKTGKSQNWTSYPIDTQQSPHPKNHEEPKKRTQSTKCRSQGCDTST
jgi:hypothetical protein